MENLRPFSIFLSLINHNSHKMVIFIFFIYVVASSQCFDLELEGEAYLDNGIINSMKNLLNFNGNGPKKERNDVNIPNKDNDEMKPVSNFNDHLDIFAKKVSYRPVTENPGLLKKQFEDQNFKESFNSELFAMKEQLSYGIMNLNNIDTLGIYNSTKIQTLLDNATNICTETFNSYFDKISESQPKNDLDREFVILDMIETTNHLLLVTAKKLIRIIQEASPTSSNHLTQLENIILEEKKGAFKYACEEIQVCRHFRGFVDKMADLINEILILNDASYSRVIDDVFKAIEGKHWFIRKIMTVDTRNDLQSKLAPWKKDPEYIRELLTIIQTVITQRYKLINNQKPQMKVKITAARILLDLIDKVLHSEDEDFFTLELDTTISSIKEWAEGITYSIMNPLKLINRIVEMLNYHWSSNTKEDVKVLFELIVSGTTRNEYVYEELFSKGAYNRRDDENEIHSDSE